MDEDACGYHLHRTRCGAVVDRRSAYLLGQYRNDAPRSPADSSSGNTKRQKQSRLSTVANFALAFTFPIEQNGNGRRWGFEESLHQKSLAVEADAIHLTVDSLNRTADVSGKQ